MRSLIPDSAAGYGLPRYGESAGMRGKIMNRYERASLIGFCGQSDSPFAGVPDWLRFSTACRAAFEIGAYLARLDEPLQGLEYVSGRKAPLFALRDGRRLAVHSEYPGTVIRAA